MDYERGQCFRCKGKGRIGQGKCVKCHGKGYILLPKEPAPPPAPAEQMLAELRAAGVAVEVADEYVAINDYEVSHREFATLAAVSEGSINALLERLAVMRQYHE